MPKKAERRGLGFRDLGIRGYAMLVSQTFRMLVERRLVFLSGYLFFARVFECTGFPKCRIQGLRAGVWGLGGLKPCIEETHLRSDSSRASSVMCLRWFRVYIMSNSKP